mmetsp:Transcript_19761/g.25503  ORF Transcript_19761/g.25503 Transcript_19761/m.25503 type:complete len:92 (-) Transcript_19761:3-278(-)
MKQATRANAKRRLSRIEGQVRGVAKMVDEERYCIDVVRQIHAIKAALSSLEKVVLDDHLEHCVESALKSSSLKARREKVEELVAVLGGRRK